MTSLSTRAGLGNQPLFTLTAGGSEEFRVVRFKAREALSGLFELHVELAGPEIELADVIDTPMTLDLASIDAPRHISGVCASFEYIGHTRHFQLYEAVVVPWLWRLQFRRSSRIFQDMSTPDIVREVLKAAGMPGNGSRFSLVETYAPRNYCVQYQEDDLSFLCRLLEEDGIFFFFEHGPDAHTVVFADNSGAHPPIPGDPTLWFVPPGGGVPDREHVQSFRFGERIRPGAVALRDFNLHRPSESMEARKQGTRHTDLEVYTYPGDYQDPGRGGSHMGQTLAKLRLEAHQAIRRVGSAASDSPRVTAGHTLTIEGHPRAELDTKYRVLHVEHTGEQPQVLDQDADGAFAYSNSFTVSELNVPFRPLQTTPRPVMRGLQTATVVGPEGEEVYTDEHGRVKVQFHWDRAEPFNESSSCWVRVSQAWAGNSWGAMFLPRIGHEVLVDFIEGDPDRPMITGRVYTGYNRPPYALPDEKTKSTIKSESSPGGGGFNELRFEDSKGSEQIFVHAQKDFDEVVLNNHTEDVGANETNTIGANQDTEVGGDRTMHVKGNFKETIDGTETRSVTGAVDETFSATETRNISADQSETVGANVKRTIGGNVTETVGGNVTQTISGSVTETVSGSVSQTVTGGITVTTPAAVNITAVGGMNVTATGGVNFIAPAGFTVIAPGGTKTIDKDFWKYGGGSGDAFGWKLAFVGMKNDFVGISTAVTAVKAEYTGISLSYKSVEAKNAPITMKQFGTNIKTGIIILYMSALISMA